LSPKFGISTSVHLFIHLFRLKHFNKTCVSLPDEDDTSENPPQWSPLQLFLMSAGLSQFTSCFVSEQIDLQALMLLTEDDLKALGLGMGPRKKLLKAINDRKAALEDPGEVSDSKL
jgi:hypothetical protein